MDLSAMDFNVQGDRLIISRLGESDGPAGDLAASIPLDTELSTGRTLGGELAGSIGNIDRVGIALFEGHALGIELAGVILLLSMVGAIVIGRKNVIAVVDEKTGASQTDIAAPQPPEP